MLYIGFTLILCLCSLRTITDLIIYSLEAFFFIGFLTLQLLPVFGLGAEAVCSIYLAGDDFQLIIASPLFCCHLFSVCCQRSAIEFCQELNESLICASNLLITNSTHHFQEDCFLILWFEAHKVVRVRYQLENILWYDLCNL
ncbi:hypothetical protein IMSAG025_00250 [Muribaculaceae bacterium]|nr:hypothetical protein IMSAG025_00250 [Muribaculaceae bacterium]